MPGFNQRGPMNEGPGTGRQAGRCTSKNKENGEVAPFTEWSFGGGAGLGKACGASLERRGCHRYRWGRRLMQRPDRSSDFQPAFEDSLVQKVKQLRSDLETLENELQKIDEM